MVRTEQSRRHCDLRTHLRCLAFRQLLASRLLALYSLLSAEAPGSAPLLSHSISLALLQGVLVLLSKRRQPGKSTLSGSRAHVEESSSLTAPRPTYPPFRRR